MRLSSPLDLDVSRTLDGKMPPRPEWPTLDGERSRPIAPTPPSRPQPPRDGPFDEWHENGRVARSWHYVGGSLHGPCAAWHPEGELELEGEWFEGRPHQLLQRWWPNGREMVNGRFAFGEPVGRWVIRDAEGRVLYDGEWRSTLRHWLPPTFADSVVAPRQTSTTPTGTGRRRRR